MKHLLYLPDGNRRFARGKRLSLEEGYSQGGKALKLFATYFLEEKGFEQFTFHVTSKYTCERTDGTFDVILKAGIATLYELHSENFFQKHNLRFIVVNHSENLPQDLIDITRILENESNDYQKVVRLLFGYDLELDVRNAYENSTNFDEFKANLLVPPIDLVIRTLEMRASGGPVYAMAQAQMMIIEKTNPEVTRSDLDQLWTKYLQLIGYRKTTNPVHRAPDAH